MLVDVLEKERLMKQHQASHLLVIITYTILYPVTPKVLDVFLLILTGLFPVELYTTFI